MVVPLRPLTSSRRLAALPVGAASTTSRSLSSQMVLMTEMV